MVPLRVLSRTNLAGSSPSTSFTSSISFASFRLRALDLSLRSFSRPDPLFSIACGLFLQNTGGGVSNTFALSFASTVTCGTWRLYPLYAQSLGAYFLSLRGYIPLRELVRCTEAQKCLFVSPLFATLTHSLSRKSFPCHSYANTRDGGVTIAPVSASVSLCLCGKPNFVRPLFSYS